MARMTHGQEISVQLIRVQCVSKGELCSYSDGSCEPTQLDLLQCVYSRFTQWVMQVHLSGFKVMLLQLVLWVYTIWAHNRFMWGSTSET